MSSTLESTGQPVTVRSRWSDDDVPAELIPERYRLGEAFVPKGRYLDPEFQQLEIDRLFARTWLMACRLRGAARRRQLRRVPDRVPFDPGRARIDRFDPWLLQRLPPPRHPPRHRPRPRRRADLPVPRLALESRRVDPPRPRPGGVRPTLRRGPRPRDGAGRHVGWVRVHQHGSDRRAAARLPRPDPDGVRAVPLREHALPVDEGRHRSVQLEDRARRVPRGVPRARHASAAHPVGQAQPQHRHTRRNSTVGPGRRPPPSASSPATPASVRRRAPGRSSTRPTARSTTPSARSSARTRRTSTSRGRATSGVRSPTPCSTSRTT